ncbi:MAG: 2-dehydro-3-deoxy-D-gluconate 5-dehydrogenase KduD [Chloroflexi bacterium]|nr:2-dehydro-3-deoxy-D-gluconate 5-dehydrogenase KduD [Chloroflexota bacterium]NOG64046.1 2-dehydro-3-deoxy-D-gluconate 5-dehydrogenase KduD [Chloroflexota bacterium]
MLDSFRLNGKVALVTGASRGLGQAMAVGLAEAGANIAVLDRTLDCNETCDLVKKAGRKFTTISCDLYSTPVSGLTDVVNTVVKELGSIDILVNNAGIIKRAPALEFSEDDWDAVLQINLKAVFFLSQAAARRMVPNGHGKIINIASMLSYQGGILVPSYTASKSGIMGITRALANEWASMGLNVNAIAPGYMSTDNTAALRADETRNASILARIPAGRWGEANDLQGAVVFLASAASDYLNGAIIPVDGGWLAR